MKFVKKFCLIFLAVILLFANTVSAKEEYVFRAKVNNEKKIAITFDDGPHPRHTVEILDVLKKYNVKATFFVIGQNVKNYSSPISRIIDEGHEIGNHSYSHSILKSMSYEKIREEISRTDDELMEMYGYTTSLIRPPCGMYDDSLVAVAKEKDSKIVLWTIDTHDWAHKSTDNIVKNVCGNIKSGDIVLFHDYISGVDNTPIALEIIIPRLLKDGYEFVTVSELLQTGNS